MANENDIVVAAWNTILFDKFRRFKHLLIDGLAPHSNEALARHGYPEGARVLDVGCGFGDSTRLIARHVGPRGEAVGVDCAENFIKSPWRKAGGHCQRSFFVVTSRATCGPYDFRFPLGTMFSCGAALRNMRKALKPGGELTMIVWRRREENPWLHDAELCVKGIVPVVSHEDTDQVHCGPGPFSMSGPDMVSSMLRGAGFDRIAFERFDADICIGKNVDDAIEFDRRASWETFACPGG
jgi:ubiquinone/menaquinone biosynthesis C-methylase UbiE